MPDPFDPAEFDAPPPSDPGADYRTLLDAMRKAGAEGVAQQVAALSRQIEQDARQRAEAGQQTQNDSFKIINILRCIIISRMQMNSLDILVTLLVFILHPIKIN